ILGEAAVRRAQPPGRSKNSGCSRQALSVAPLLQGGVADSRQPQPGSVSDGGGAGGSGQPASVPDPACAGGRACEGGAPWMDGELVGGARPDRRPESAT